MDSFWSNVERLSWVVSIVVLPLAIVGATVALYQLRAFLREQRRIGAELAKQPRPVVGFLPLLEKDGNMSLPQQAEVTATWQPGERLSAPVEITVACYNTGTRTAREMLYNFTFGREFGYLATEPQVPNRGMLTPNPLNGLPVWLVKDERMHPGDSSWFTLPLRIPAGMRVVQIDAEVSLQDQAAIKAQLRLVVHSATPGGGPPGKSTSDHSAD